MSELRNRFVGAMLKCDIFTVDDGPYLSGFDMEDSDGNDINLNLDLMMSTPTNVLRFFWADLGGEHTLRLPLENLDSESAYIDEQDVFHVMDSNGQSTVIACFDITSCS
jgi:hypothetical protein